MCWSLNSVNDCACLVSLEKFYPVANHANSHFHYLLSQKFPASHDVLLGYDRSKQRNLAMACCGQSWLLSITQVWLSGREIPRFISFLVFIVLVVLLLTDAPSSHAIISVHVGSHVKRNTDLSYASAPVLRALGLHLPSSGAFSIWVFSKLRKLITNL